MDKFDDNKERWSRMSRQGREQEMRKIKLLCTCPKCPSYNSCSEDRTDLSFCMVGKSECKFSELGCICGSCPVAEQWGLLHQYYCMFGSELQVRGPGRDNPPTWE